MSDKISKIIYINLDKRVDRREHIEKELNDFGLSYERFAAIETQGFGIVGCGLSHLQVFKIAKERNYENILILEDDFTFLVTKEELEKQLTDFFNLQLDYDVLFLSYNLNKHLELDNGVVHKVVDSQSASGYIVHNRCYDKLIQLYEHAIPLLEKTKMHWVYANDKVWIQLQETGDWYYFIKRLGKQIASYSDNTESFMDYNV